MDITEEVAWDEEGTLEDFSFDMGVSVAGGTIAIMLLDLLVHYLLH